MAISHQFDGIATALAHPDFYRRGYRLLLTVSMCLALIILVLAAAAAWFTWQPDPQRYYTTSYAGMPVALSPKILPAVQGHQ